MTTKNNSIAGVKQSTAGGSGGSAQQPTMSSVQLAKIANRPHNDLLKSMRKMEEAWKKIGQGNFSQSSYLNSQGKKQPMYLLTKMETLYIATKFNDQARARLILRWAELELQSRKRESNLLAQTLGDYPHMFLWLLNHQ